MLPAIDLDHEFRPMAGKVGDEVPDRDLSAPTRVGRDGTQQPPHRPLRFGHVATQLTGATDVLRRRVLVHAPELTEGSPPSKLR